MDDANCKECGHMKCMDVTRGDPQNLIFDDGETGRRLCKRKKRSNRAKRYCAVSCNTDSSSLTFADSSMSVSNIDLQEQEEVALSLILLSRDVNGVIGSIQTGNPEFLRCVKTKERQSRTSSFVDSKNHEIGSLEVSSPKSWIDKNGFSSDRLGSNCKKLKSSSSRKFTCIVCRKVFASYQALGGHRASRKKFKRCCIQNESFPNPRDKILEERIREGAGGRKKSTNDHECPICCKVFPSGQALGGHMRSHLVTPNQHIQSMVDPSNGIATKEIQNFLDLNLPTPSEKDCRFGFSLIDPSLKSSTFAL